MVSSELHHRKEPYLRRFHPTTVTAWSSFLFVSTRRMNFLKTLGISLTVFFTWSSLAPAQTNKPTFAPGTWEKLNNPAPDNMGPCLVLTDGRVACNHSQADTLGNPNSDLWSA